ncbi:MAG: sel1 repeat family protein [Bacteroidaceae bacterium]|nr:sel1 repeat family protein [Bacteroidaceae bacterium]
MKKQRNYLNNTKFILDYNIIMLRYFFLMIASLSFVDSFSQEIVVAKMVITNSVQASTRRRDDTKGEACALLKVQFPNENTYFKGNIIGDVEFRTNSYWIYMPEGTNEIDIINESYPSKKVSFSEYGIDSLKSKYTYELTLLGKRKDAPEIFNEGMIAWAENDMVKAYMCLNQAANDGYKYAYYSLSRMFTFPNNIKSAFYNEINQLAVQYDSKNESGKDVLYLFSTNNIDQKVEDIRNKAIEFEEKHNLERAIYWYQRGDEKGDHVSQYRLGRLYFEGKGIKQNYKKALELFQKASYSLFDFKKLTTETDEYTSEAMAALSYMYMNGLGVPANLDLAIQYAWFSGSDTGQNILGLYYYKKKEYTKARRLLNIQPVPDFSFVDSIIRKDVLFSLGMYRYWGLAKELKLMSLAKDYFKKAAKLGDKRAQRIVNATCIGNVTSEGVITGNKIVVNGQEIHIPLGRVRNDGAVLYSNSKEEIVCGKIDNQGVFWKSNTNKLGQIDNKGIVYSKLGEKLGSVDDKGNVKNGNGETIGKLKGLPISYALLYFFFDVVCDVQFTDYVPDME